MPTADQQEDQWREALTRLTRLAQRRPEARDWIEDMLRRNMPAILAPALQVAEETGDPLPDVLARVVSADAPMEMHEAMARAVPMGPTDLQALGIASLRALLNRESWSGETAPVRRHALQVALANRLFAAGRRDEARAAAQQALANTPDDPSSLARSIDAYDVLGECQAAAGDPQGAVENARRGLALRESLKDPLRGQAEGELILGLTLLEADVPDEACRILRSAVSHSSGLLASNRDAWSTYEDQLADGANIIHATYVMGFLSNGFDRVVAENGFRVEFLVAQFHHCLEGLLRAFGEHGERLSAGVRNGVLTELAAASALLRRGLNDTSLRIRIFRLLSSEPTSPMPPLSEDDFDAMADEALAANDRDLAAEVRMAQVNYLRRQDPVDRRALVNALSDLSRLSSGADAVRVAREAVEVANG
jgi:tetratricopeptide (TPR) repeat protein